MDHDGATMLREALSLLCSIAEDQTFGATSRASAAGKLVDALNRGHVPADMRDRVERALRAAPHSGDE